MDQQWDWRRLWAPLSCHKPYLRPCYCAHCALCGKSGSNMYIYVKLYAFFSMEKHINNMSLKKYGELWNMTDPQTWKTYCGEAAAAAEAAAEGHWLNMKRSTFSQRDLTRRWRQAEVLPWSRGLQWSLAIGAVIERQQGLFRLLPRLRWPFPRN